MEKGRRSSSFALNLVIAILGAVLIVLCIWGFYDLRVHEGKPVDAFHFVLWLYEAFKVALFHGHFDDNHINWQLKIAVCLAMFESVAITFWGAIHLFPERLARMLFPFKKNHVVVTCLNRRSSALIHKLRAQGKMVAVIEQDAANPLLESCQHDGALIFIGDATEHDMLLAARLPQAAHLVSICSTDSVNADIAASADEMLRKFPKRLSPVKCHVHITDYALMDWLRHNDIMSARERSRIHARLFDTYEFSARMLLRKHSLDREPITGADSVVQVHLVIAGFGLMGEALALQVAKECHFANLKKPRISVVDHDARQKENAFLNRFPKFREVCEFECIAGDMDDPLIIASFKKWAEEKETLETIAVCFDSDAASLACALGLRRIAEPEGIPIRVRMSSKTGLAHLLEDSSRDTNVAFTPFGLIEECCTPEMVLRDELNQMAREIRDAESSSADWELLAPELRENSIQKAIHVKVKLRAIGCAASKTALDSKQFDKVESLTKQEIELLARMEHSRSNAERFLTGWTLERSLNKDDVGRGPQETDRAFVEALPAVLKKAGYGIYRRKVTA